MPANLTSFADEFEKSAGVGKGKKFGKRAEQEESPAVYYHGTPHKLTTLRAGSWVTPFREDALRFGIPWGSKDLVFKGDDSGRPPLDLVFKPGRMPPDAPVYVYRVEGEVVPADTNTGRTYDWNRRVTKDTKVTLVDAHDSWRAALQKQAAADPASTLLQMPANLTSFADELVKLSAANPVGANKYKSARGGLTQAGREKFKREEGSNLKPGVRGAADTPEKQRRKGSFLSRMFGPGAKGAMTDEKGRPTRRALSAQAWGESVPKDDAGRARLYAKGQSLLKQYKQTKTASQQEPDPRQLERMRKSMASLLKKHGLPADDPHMIVAGAALYGHGMRDKFDDIDVYLPGLKNRVNETHKGINIEAFPDFMIGGKDVGPEAIKTVQRHPTGLQFMSPERILEHKRDMNRPKDQRDIAVLEAFLKNR